MASFVMHVVRGGRLVVKKNICKNVLLGDKSVRQLFSDQQLGLDKFEEQRNKVAAQFTGLKDKFCTRMRGYINQEGQTMIFTEDLKNMLHVAEDNPQDIDLCIQMMHKFHKQNKELKFGTFVFGPVAMRWLHAQDKADLAYQLITNEELSGFFDQVTSYCIAMDLLFKHHRYDDVLHIFQLLQDKNLQGSKYPKEPLLLALGALYHLNAPESLQKTIALIQAARETGMTVVRRGYTFAAALALKQGETKIAMEMLSLTPHSNYITVRNLRLRVLADMNRTEDIFPILRQVIDRDVPRSTPAYKDICQETLDHVQKKIEETQDKEMSHIFEQICRALKENNHITSETVDQLLEAPIQSKQTHRGDREVSYQQGSTSRPNRSYNAYRGESHRYVQPPHRQRNGLKDTDDY